MSEQRHRIAVPALLSEDTPESLLYQSSDGALRLRHTEIQRHVLHLKSLLASLVLQHDIAHLRAVAMPDYHAVTRLQHRDQASASFRNILYLFTIGAFLMAFQ